MLTLITGAPGAGKTAAVVSMIEELGQGRAVYVSGIPDLVIPHVDLEDASKWPDVVEDGAIIVIDEAQRVWRPAGSGAKVPRDIELLETHRHRGLDFYVITQMPRLVHSNVRALCGRHVHLRDVGILGRWWYEWPECGNTESFKSAPLKKRYKLPKKIFDKYKSATVHVKPVRGIPRSIFVVGFCIIAFGFLAWRLYGSISGKLQPEAAKVAPVVAGVPPGASAPGGGQVERPAHAMPIPSAVHVVPAFTVPVRYMPAELAGCVVTETDCTCWTNTSPAIRITDLGRNCVDAAHGRFAVHPSRVPVIPEVKGDAPKGAAASVSVSG